MKYDNFLAYYDSPFAFYDSATSPERRIHMAKIKLDHVDLGIAEFIVRMNEIKTAMTTNPVFAALAAKVTAFGTVIATLETKNGAYNTASQTCTTALTERDNARLDCEAVCAALANSSQGETADAAELLSGGWHLRSDGSPVGAMPMPENLSATGGDQEGEVDLHWQPVRGRDSYIGEYSTSATGPWTEFYVGKKSRATATGLTPGVMYYFRLRAVNTEGRGPWSDIAQHRAS
jgi:hypothetical protein